MDIQNGMTDNEIIKVLECCRDCNCKECPCCRVIDGGMHCTEIDEEEILNLINRQKAEIERLDAVFKQSQDNCFGILSIAHEQRNKIKTAKTEAIKDFAERLKVLYKDYDGNVGAVGKPVLFRDIDNLVKEMTESK